MPIETPATHRQDQPNGGNKPKRGDSYCISHSPRSYGQIRGGRKMKPTYKEIRAAAQYRWPEIHATFGIDPRYLKNKHQPCPACGGKDRFRYDDKDGNGTFICSHYNNGAGDGFGLPPLLWNLPPLLPACP